MVRISARPLLPAMLLGTTMLAGGGLPAPAHAQQAEGERRYDIPAGTLAKALSQFADESGIQISYEAELTEGRTTSGLRGRFTRSEALSRLLSGTGLVARQTGPDSVTIATARTGRLDLDPMRVEGSMAAADEDGKMSLGERASRDSSTIVVIGHYGAGDKKASTGPWGSRDLVDTPYSVSVMSSQQIENTIARDLDQLYKMNPVVQVNAPMTIFGYPSVIIRGFNQSTGIVDGVRLSSYTYGLSTEEIEKVEVMNGLSGFLYGAGNVGGVANYVLKRPTYEPLANLTAGNYGGKQYFAHVDLGGRLDGAGTFAYRFNAAYANGDTSKDDQQLKKWLVSGAIDWNVASNLLLQLEAAHTYWRLDRVDTRFYASGLAGWPDAYDVRKTYTPDWTYNQTKSDRIGVNLRYDVSESLSLRSAYLYKKDNREFIIIYPINTPTGWTMYAPGKTTPYDTVSQGAYAYLDASFDTGGIRHKLTVGGSWDTYREDKHVNSYISGSNSDGTPYQTPVNLTVEQLLDLAAPLFSADYGPRYKATEATNRNIIVGDDIAFTDRLSALVGFNYSTIETKAFNTSGVRTSGYRKSAVTPTVSVIYKPIPSLTTYVSYMEGLEAGSIVPDDPNLYANPGMVLDPVISRQYEVGAKYAFSEGLLLTSALFRIEKANSFNSIGADGRITVNQDGRQIHQGVEITLTGRVTEHLNVVAGGTLMDLGIEKASNAALKGKKPVGSSPVLAKISLDYAVPGIDGLALSGGAYHSGSKYQDSANLNKIDSYTIFDLGVRYATTVFGRKTTFNLYVTNLTDEDYWSSYWQLGLPRNVAFSLRTEF